MNVIPMPVEISLVPDGVLLKSPLPDGSFAPLHARLVSDSPGSNLLQIAFGEQPFDLSPAFGIIGIPLWQRPDTMDVFPALPAQQARWQQTDGIDGERKSLKHNLPRRAQ